MDATRECLERLLENLRRLPRRPLERAMQHKLVLEVIHRLEAEPADSPYRDLLQPLHEIEETFAPRAKPRDDSDLLAERVSRAYGHLSSILGKEPKP